MTKGISDAEYDELERSRRQLREDSTILRKKIQARFTDQEDLRLIYDYAHTEASYAETAEALRWAAEQ